MADVYETDLLGKVFFETSPNTGTATWTNHTATVSNMSLSRGGGGAAVGVSNVEVGSAVISLVDNTATIGIGYWVRVRTLSGNVWAGFVQDISTNFEIINGVTYEIKSLYCVDWVGYAGQVLLENALGFTNATGAAPIFMPYSIVERIHFLNYSFDNTGQALVITRDGSSSAVISHGDQTNSIAGNLDLLANSVGGYWNSTTATPTNGTTGRDGLILFSKRATPVASGVTFSNASTPFQALTFGRNTSSIANSVILRNRAQVNLGWDGLQYKTNLMYSQEYGASLPASISSYGARQISLETNLGLPLRAGFLSASTEARNQCRNPNFETSIDGWVGSSQARLQKYDADSGAYSGDSVLRIRAIATTSAVSAEYAPADTLGVEAKTPNSYGIIGYVTKQSGTGSNHQAQIICDFYDDDDTLLSTSTQGLVNLGADFAWTRLAFRVTPPSNAQKAKFRFRFQRTSGNNIASGTKYWLDNVSYFKSGNASDSYENQNEGSQNNDYISFSLGSVGDSESITIDNLLYDRALEIANDNDEPQLVAQTLTWNAQTDLSKVHLLDLNKTVDITTSAITSRQKVVGIRHEISRNKWITQLELEAKQLL